MAFIIEDKNEVLATFRMDGTPEWSLDPDNAWQLTTKKEAVTVRDQLRKFGLNPKINKRG